MRNVIQGFVYFLTLNDNWKLYKPALKRSYGGMVEVSKKWR